MTKVAILGGGVAGLSAAHELVERGYSVAIYEAKPIWGGKARSMGKAGTGTGGRRDLPGEHGFRFFPGFCKHQPDTMKRIPCGADAHGVYDNLVGTTQIGRQRGGAAGSQCDPAPIGFDRDALRSLVAARAACVCAAARVRLRPLQARLGARAVPLTGRKAAG